jgi:HK97 family phage major capsid protein
MSDEIIKYSEEEKQDASEIIKKQRELLKKYGEDSSIFKRYMEESDEYMKKYDGKHEEIMKQLATKDKELEEQKERIEHLESLGSMIKTDVKTEDVHAVANAIFKKTWYDFAQKNEAEAFNYVKEMQRIIEFQGDNFPSELASFKYGLSNIKAAPDLLRTDIGEFGGFTVPISWSNRLREQIIEVSPARQFATVEQISGKTIMMPVRQGVPEAFFEGEAEESQSGIPNYTTNQLTPHRLAVTIPITWDMLNNNAYNISQRIMDDARKSFAAKEGKTFVVGDGVKKPLGFTQDNDVPIYSSFTATLTFDDVIKISGELKQGYNPWYYFNRRTLVYLRTLADQNDRFLWAGPFGDAAAGVPQTINGIPYSASFIDMDDFDVNDGYPILFADMKEFYTITDRQDMVIIRDEVTQKKKAVVEFEVMKWTHGQPVIKEAGILLKKIA